MSITINFMCTAGAFFIFVRKCTKRELGEAYALFALFTAGIATSFPVAFNMVAQFSMIPSVIITPAIYLFAVWAVVKIFTGGKKDFGAYLKGGC